MMALPRPSLQPFASARFGCSDRSQSAAEEDSKVRDGIELPWHAYHLEYVLLCM